MTVEEMRKIALAKYNTGGDVIIECWTTEDCQEFVSNYKDDARKELYNLMSLYHERAEGIRNTAF